MMQCSHRSSKKRPRQPHAVLAAAAAAAALLVHSANGYSSVRLAPRTSRHSTTSLRYTDTVSDHSSALDLDGRSGQGGAVELHDSLNDDTATMLTTSTDLPPWLSRYFHPNSSCQQAIELDWLEHSLLRQHSIPANEIREVIQSFQMIVTNDPTMAQGLADFLRLILEMENELENSSILVSKDFLIASMLHYADCMNLRRSARAPSSSLPDKGNDTTKHQAKLSEWAYFYKARLSPANCPTSSFMAPFQYQQALGIANGAAQIKRAELLAQTSVRRRHLPEEEFRNLILTVMEDWRSLALRCIACLYRLEGILEYQSEIQSYETTPEIVYTAREAMRVFAVLSERLGMHRLKAKIEERAFSILYKRQYRAVSTLYHNSRLPMQKLSKHLLRSVTKTLQADDALMGQLEDLQVTARVKEPFSFWKKLLKRKSRSKNALLSASRDTSAMLADASTIKTSLDASSIAINDLHDGIALRVIIRARKWTEDESEESIRAREHLLCYYVQMLVRAKWPEHDASRIKDYIAFPKPNGYQSLHHTSMVLANGIRFPFEVQVRSEEMHSFAEFGVAAHWDYKLACTKQPLQPPSMLKKLGSSVDMQSIAGLLPPSKTQADRSKTDDDLALVPSTRSRQEEKSTRSRQELKSIMDLDNERYIEALALAKERVQKEQVYVFMVGDSPPDQGRLISLPIQSSVADVIAAGADSQDSASTALDATSFWRNGKLAQLSDPVENGDFVVVSGDAELVNATTALHSYS